MTQAMIRTIQRTVAALGVAAAGLVSGCAIVPLPVDHVGSSIDHEVRYVAPPPPVVYVEPRPIVRPIIIRPHPRHRHANKPRLRHDRRHVNRHRHRNHPSVGNNRGTRNDRTHRNNHNNRTNAPRRAVEVIRTPNNSRQPDRARNRGQGQRDVDSRRQARATIEDAKQAKREAFARRQESFQRRQLEQARQSIREERNRR